MHISHLTPLMVNAHSLRTVPFSLAHLAFMERPLAQAHQSQCLQVYLIFDSAGLVCLLLEGFLKGNRCPNERKEE